MNTTQEKQDKPLVKVDEATKRRILGYARLKRIEKRLNDKLEKAKESILASVGNVECIAIFADSKLATVSEKQRDGIDTKKLQENFPLVYKEVFKEGKPYLELRIH